MFNIGNPNKGGVGLFIVILLILLIAAAGFTYFYSTELSMRSGAVINYNEIKNKVQDIQSAENQKIIEQQKLLEGNSF